MLRQIVRRVFVPDPASEGSVPGPTALAQVYLRVGRYFVEPSDRTRWSEAGYWVSTGRVTILDSTAADEALGAAVLAALGSSQLEVPVPPRGTKLEAGLFRAMGVRSRRAAMSGTRSCMVTREPPGGTVHVEPLRNGGTAGDDRGYAGISDRAVTLPAAGTPSEVGRAVRAAMAHAIVVT